MKLHIHSCANEDDFWRIRNFCAKRFHSMAVSKTDTWLKEI